MTNDDQAMHGTAGMGFDARDTQAAEVVHTPAVDKAAARRANCKQMAEEFAAQCWARPATQHLVMQPELATAFANELAGWLEFGAQMQDNMSFYRDIVHQIGELFGNDAKTSDDGSLQDSVLALKVPELVRGVVAECARLDALINNAETENFLSGVQLEAAHQVERWGEASDRAKRPADWFWLVGYLAGKALHAQSGGDRQKALHHCISTAAALFNWHCAIAGHPTPMSPGSSDIARIVDAAFPGEASAEVPNG